MSAPGPVLLRLRSATADAHDGLEAALDAPARLSSVDDRRALLPRYYRMHASADPVLATWLGGLVDLDLAARQRTSLLKDDLHRLGVQEPRADALPKVAFTSAAEALGFLYVLEGSSLGGRVILKQLATRNADAEGLSFLDPYGAETGARWRDFLSVLEREGAAEIDDVAKGGIRGFAHARYCLLEGNA